MLGKTLGGRYHIVKHLGGGGFGQTYLASDRQLPGNPLCVVKLLLPQATDADTLAIARRLFDREAQVLYRLGKHEQIPNLLAHFEEDKEFYLVQEFIEGNELKAELPLGKQLSEAKVIAILLDILKVLEFVHKQDVIHRDIKPSNLIRRQQDRKIFLIDFGAVKEVSATEAKSLGQTTLTVAIGSPGYMPNEQISGNPKFCSDIYAVGMIGIQALTGIPANGLPFDSETSELMWRDRANVSQQLADVLDKMVRYDYRQRYQTVTHTLQALELVNSQQSTQAYSTPTHKLTPPLDDLTKPLSPSTQPLQTSPSVEQTIRDIAGSQQQYDPPAAELIPSNLTQPSANSKLPAETALSHPTSPNFAESSLPKAGIEINNAEGVANSRQKLRRLSVIGTGIATALVAIFGIYYLPKLNSQSSLNNSNNTSQSLGGSNNSWNQGKNISLAYNLSGHSKEVNAIAISPDGKILASGSNDNTINVWNLSTGQRLFTLKGHTDYIYSVAFSPDGQKIASASGDGTVKIWNLQTGQLLQTLQSNSENRVFSVTFTPDGQTLVSGNKDKTIKLWNPSTGQLKNTLKGHSEFVLTVAVSPDGKTLASSGYDKTIKIWNLPAGTLISSVAEPTGNTIPSLAISPDGQTLASSDIYNKVHLWNLAQLLSGCKGAQPCSPTHSISAHKDYVNFVAFSPDGKTLASGSRDETIKLWKVQTGELESSISNRSGNVNAVTFSPDGKTLVSNGENGKIEVWRSR